MGGGSDLLTIAYPTILQGDNICVTRGIVSRVTTLPYEDQKYGMLSKELLAIQVQALSGLLLITDLRPRSDRRSD